VVNPVVEKYQAWATAHPEAAANLESVADIAGLLVGGKGVQKVAEKGVEGAMGVARGSEKVIDVVEAGKDKVVGAAKGIKNVIKPDEAIVAAQKESGVIPTLDTKIIQKAESEPKFKTLVEDAKKQGYSEKEINFLGSVSDTDKPVLKKMFDMTAKAQKDPRQIERAADVLGENANSIFKQVSAQNKTAGKAVNTAAKALKGQIIDATPVRQRAMKLLEEADVTANADGSPDWSTSIFKKSPAIQKELKRALSDLPNGEMDAYEIHKFKKSLDEIVEFGTGGEGLKGRSASILKAIRKEADEILDKNFASYNKANTEFKLTRDFMEKVEDVVGTKVDFSTPQGAQAFGQQFRSAFSNNKSRGKTLALIEELQNIAKTRKLKGAEQNILDQAIYVTLLEDTFGSAAATGLASEVRKGMEAVNKGVQAFRDPIKGGANLVVDLYEKSKNISPEAKKDLLQRFLGEEVGKVQPTVKPKAKPKKK
jgi:methylphosphotriester-DNA--protein-cysteine methyltransferase